MSYFGKRLCYISELQSQIRALENRLTLYSAAVTKEGECFQQLVAVRNMPVAYNAWFLFFSFVFSFLFVLFVVFRVVKLCCVVLCYLVCRCVLLCCVVLCVLLLCQVMCFVLIFSLIAIDWSDDCVFYGMGSLVEVSRRRKFNAFFLVEVNQFKVISSQGTSLGATLDLALF